MKSAQPVFDLCSSFKKPATKRETEWCTQLYVHAILASRQNNAANVKRLRSIFCRSEVPLGAELLQTYVRDGYIHLLLAYPLTLSTLQLVSEYVHGTGVLKHSLQCIERLMNATLEDCLVRMGGWVSMNANGRVCSMAQKGNSGEKGWRD